MSGDRVLQNRHVHLPMVGAVPQPPAALEALRRTVRELQEAIDEGVVDGELMVVCRDDLCALSRRLHAQVCALETAKVFEEAELQANTLRMLVERTTAQAAVVRRLRMRLHLELVQHARYNALKRILGEPELLRQQVHALGSRIVRRMHDRAGKREECDYVAEATLVRTYERRADAIRADWSAARRALAVDASDPV